MKKAKRALALALVFALVASFCVTGAAAAPGQGEQQTVVNGQYVGEEWQQGGTGSVTENGVTVSKTATATGDSNKYFVTLEVVTPVTTSTTSASAATVLVIDRSNSMGYCEECGESYWHEWWCGYRDEGQNVQNNQTRLYAAQQAACTFLDNYRDETSTAPRYVAVVAFAGRNGTSTVVNWVNVNDEHDLARAKEAINGLQLRSSTNLNAGLEEAEDLLNNNAIRDVPSGNRYVIALTDGSPTSETADAIDTATSIKNDQNNSATIYTVCFGAANDEVRDFWYNGQNYRNLSVSEYLRDHIATSGSTAFDADNAQELYDAFDQLTQSITGGLTGLTVTDPMAEGVTLETEFRGNSGVDITGGDIEWTLSNPDRDEQAGTDTYTLNYTVTVNPDDFKDQKAGYYPLNGRTFLTIPSTDGQTGGVVQFPVPGVYVTPTSSTEEQDVYVYVKVVGAAGADGNLSDEELAEVRGWGLTTLNKDGYFTIGKVSGCMLPATNAYVAGTNIIDNYRNAVNINSIVRHEDNEAFTLDDVEWYTLHTANGATDYSEVSSDTLCWHLDGKITLEQLEKRLVTVTYDKNATNATGEMEPQSVIKGFDVTLSANTFTYQGHTFTGWNTDPNGNGTPYSDKAHIDALNENLTLYAQWSLNTNEITIQVYVDGTKVSITEENFDRYISGLQNGTNTENWQQSYNDDGDIVGTYSYDNYDSADIVLTPNSNYVLQGIKGTFIQGEKAWTGITPSGTAWTIDNVKGGTTLSVYLNTKYSVEYVVPDGFEAPEDTNTYITVEGLQDVSAPSFGSDIDPNKGVEGGWKNPDTKIKTEITIETLPQGTNGWTDEANGSKTEGDKITVSEAVAAGLNGDDNTFTFTATANEYTVTYTDGVEGIEVFADQIYDNLTYGTATPGFEGTPEREGYNFVGWNPAVADTVTETVTYVAQWKEITGTLTVTKTVEADKETVTLPEGFTITVTGTSGAAAYDDSYTLTIGVSGDENIKYSYNEASGTHQWVISGAALGTYNVTEANYKVEGYLCEGDEDKTATITDANGEEVTLTNSYTLISRELSVVKTVIKVGETDVEEGAAIPAAKVGETIIYEIVVTNNSNVALENISVTDELVNSVLYSDEGCTVTASATIESLEADGGSATFYAKYKVTAADAEAGSVTNTATAKSGDTTGTGTEEVDVKKQYTLTINHYYDEVSGATVQASAVQTLNEGDSWTATPLTNVDKNGVNYIFDASLSTSPLSGTISGNVTVDLVYVKDEWKDDDPDGDSETGGDGTPDYKQARILYEVAEGQDDMGGVSPTIDVVTLTDDDGDGEYSGSVPAESTATPEDGSVFVSWSGNGYSPEVQTNELSHEFTAVGGETYTYTASFKTGTTDAEVTKTLVSYTRDGVTVDEIPEGFKARVGDVLNYKITIKNTGEIALEDVTVSDTLWGSGVTSAMVGGTDTDVSGGSCTVNVASGSSVTITYSYTVQADDIGQTITNTATVDLPGDDDPKDEEEVTVDDYSVTITPADIVAYTGGDGYSAVVGEDNQYINDSTSGLPEPGYHVVLSDAVVDWLNDNGVAAGDGLTDDATDLADVLSFTYDDGTNKRNWSLRYVGVYSYNASGNPSAYVYSIVTETAGAPSVSLKYFDDLNGDGVADDNEVITSDDIMMSANQVNHTYKMTIEGGDLDQSQVKAVLEADGKSLTTDIDIGIGELTVLSTTNEETTNSIAGNAAGVDSGVITAVGNDSITYYVNESGVSFNDEDLVSRVQLLIDEVTNETSGEFETAMAEAAFDAISADLRNAEYEMCYMDLVDTENGNAKVTFSGGELSIYWPLPDGASASDSFYIVHFTELDREHAAVGTDVLDTTNKDVIAGEVMRIGGEYYVTFDVGSFSPFVLVYGDDGGDEPWWPPIGPGDDDDDGDDDVDREFVPKWLNIDDHYAYIIGYEDGTVRPQGNITRAEVATIFFRLLTDEVREEYWSTESGYSDVSSSDWYNNAISTLSNLGVITGYEDGTFRPNASISRAEFVTIATRFFDYTAEYEGTFSDVSYSSWYADFVQAAVDMGLVNGYENGTFRPNASITRAEAVAIVNRVLLRRPDADHLLPWSVMNTFSDNVLESAWYYEDIQEATNSHDYEWLKSGVEDWTEKLPERDWAALEREWSSAYDAPGGEVTG